MCNIKVRKTWSVPIDTNMIDKLSSSDVPQPADSSSLCDFKGQYKAQPSDFIVHEKLGFEPGGGGEHLYLHVEKEHLTTFEAVDILAKAFGASARNIGYSGMKDKLAITRQWFSVPTSKTSDTLPQTSSSSGQLKVLEAHRHARKLRIGTHKSNAFELIIRHIGSVKNSATENPQTIQKALNRRIADLTKRGYPNYVGPQRFGKNGNNIAKAIHHLENPQRKIKPKTRGLYLSALRSALFNQVLAKRIENQSWLMPMFGEPMMLAGSRSVFLPGDNDSQDELQQRLEACDISTTGLLSGEGESGATAACAAFESQSLAEFISVIDALSQSRVRADRRALRAVVTQVKAVWLDEQTLQLKFSLPPGAYASMLVRNLSSGFNQYVPEISAEF